VAGGSGTKRDRPRQVFQIRGGQQKGEHQVVNIVFASGDVGMRGVLSGLIAVLMCSFESISRFGQGIGTGTLIVRRW